MKLKLHIANEFSDSQRTWLEENDWDVLDSWMDCTKFIQYFNTNDVNSFCQLMNEFCSIDLIFDKWILVV